MKKVIIIFVLLLSAVTFTKAQGVGGQVSDEKRAQAAMKRIPATLNLTDAQKSQILAIYTAQLSSQDSLKTAMESAKASGGDMAPLMARRKALNASTNAKILVLLTDEQRKAYQEYMKSHHQGSAKGGKKGHRTPATPAVPATPGN